MNKNKFRGKRIDNGEWVYGGYHKHIKRTACPIEDKITDEDIAYLIIESGFSDWNMPKPINVYEVIPETVGQFTGLKDKNDKEIWQGDILKTDSEVNYVDYQDYSFGTHNHRQLIDYIWGTSIGELHYFDDVFEVIGNIYDNPELLESEMNENDISD